MSHPRFSLFAAVLIATLFIPVAASAAGPYFWMIQTIRAEGWPAVESDVTVDSDDNLHVAYFDGSPYFWDLDYTTNLSGGWDNVIIDNSGEVGYFPTISVNDAGDVFIVHSGLNYTEGDHGTWYAENIGGTGWVTEAAQVAGYGEGDVARYPTAAMDADDHAHICFWNRDENQLGYATNKTGEWVTEYLVSMRQSICSIAVDSDGYPHIGFSDIDSYLTHATNESGSWAYEVVGAWRTGRYSSTTVDPLDNVHIAYDRYYTSELKYATNASGDWEVEDVELDTGDARHVQIELDSSDYAHIAFYDFDNGTLRYASNSSGEWAVETLDYVGVNWNWPNPPDEGWGCSEYDYRIGLAIDSLDEVHITYFDKMIQDLMYARLTEDVQTPIELAYFEAKEIDGEVVISWGTETERDNAGFHLWRSMDETADYSRITAKLIPARGDATPRRRVHLPGYRRGTGRRPVVQAGRREPYRPVRVPRPDHGAAATRRGIRLRLLTRARRSLSPPRAALPEPTRLGR